MLLTPFENEVTFYNELTHELGFILSGKKKAILESDTIIIL